MTVPQSTVTQVQGAFGAAQSNIPRRVAVIGCAAAGPLLQAERVTLARLKSLFKAGPAMKGAAYVIGKTLADVIFLRMNADTVAASATIDSSQFTGTSTLSTTGTANGFYSIVVEFTTPGTVGTSASYKISLNGGQTFSAIVALGVATTITITGTGLTLVLNSGDTVDGSVLIEAQPGSPVVYGVDFTNDAPVDASDAVISGTPIDAYNGKVVFEVGGTVADPNNVIRYKVSLDGGKTYAPSKRLGAAALTFVIMDYNDVSTGLTVTVDSGDNIAAGAVLVFRTTAPQPLVSEIPDAIAELRNKEGNSTIYGWEFVWLYRDSVRTDMAAVASALDTIQAAGPNQGFRWAIGHTRLHHENQVIEDWGAALVVNFDPLEDTRLAVAAGGSLVTCPVTGRHDRRPATLPVVARLIERSEEEDPGKKEVGPLPADVDILDDSGNAIEYDARTDSTLHDARFVTLRTYFQEPGVFCTRGNIFCAPGAAYSRIPIRRIDNIFAETVKVYGNIWLNKEFAGNPVTRTIGAIAADDFRDNVSAILSSKLIVPTRKLTVFSVAVDLNNIMIGVTPVNLVVNYEWVSLVYVDNVVATVTITDSITLTPQ